MKKKIAEDAPMNATGAGVSLPATKGSILRRLRRKALPEESFGRIGAKTPVKRSLKDTLSQIKRAMPADHPINKAFQNPYKKIAPPLLPEPKPLKSLGEGKTETPIGHTHTIEVPHYRNGTKHWRKLKGASFSSIESAHHYGNKYHVGKSGEIRFKVVPLKQQNEEFEDYEGSRSNLKNIQTIYVRRPLLNVNDIKKWADTQGLTLEPDLHVTIIYSKTPVDWATIGPDIHKEVVLPGGLWFTDLFGPEKDTLVLRLYSEVLDAEHRYFRDCGASWDWGDYQPHLTITKGIKDNKNILPYRGLIILGPEIMEPVKIK